MSDQMQGVEFTPEEICTQATGNAIAGGLALVRYARELGESPEVVAAWLGRTFAPGWEEMRGQGALNTMRTLALNLVSLGCDVRSLTGDERRAEAVAAGWPGDDNLMFFGVSQNEADALFGVFGPIAQDLDLRYDWQREGDTVRMTFEQARD